jgi:hypothetical protein
MTSGLEINRLIMDTIYENSPDETVIQLILDSLQYELDIWNRYVSWSEISGQYELMVDRVVRGMLD